MTISEFLLHSITNEGLDFYKTASYRGKNVNKATVALRPKTLTLAEDQVTSDFRVRQEVIRKDPRKRATDDTQQHVDMIARFYGVAPAIHDNPVIDRLRALQTNSRSPPIASEFTIMPNGVTLSRKPDLAGRFNESPNRCDNLILVNEDKWHGLSARKYAGFPVVSVSS